MIRLTALFARKSAVAVQPMSVESLWLAASPLGSAAATASSLRGWSKTLSAAALFLVCVCATSTVSAQWTITDLGTLPGGSSGFSAANGINDAGQVVGSSSSATGTRAFLWQNGVMTNLGDLPGGADNSVATSINNSGQVVGYSEAATGYRSFLWQNGVMTDLGAMPVGNMQGFPFFRNNVGQTAGTDFRSTGAYVVVSAFLSQNGVDTYLGDLPGGDDFSVARGINNVGQVVGNSGAATGVSAFLWQDGVMTDLNAVSGVVGTGWSLTQAEAINDFGQIVGSGTNPQGLQHAFILTPVPEPEVYLMMGVGVCLAGVIARRRKQISR